LFNGPIECRLFEIPLTRGVYRPRANVEQSSEQSTENTNDIKNIED